MKPFHGPCAVADKPEQLQLDGLGGLGGQIIRVRRVFSIFSSLILTCNSKLFTSSKHKVGGQIDSVRRVCGAIAPTRPKVGRTSQEQQMPVETGNNSAIANSPLMLRRPEAAAACGKGTSTWDRMTAAGLNPVADQARWKRAVERRGIGFVGPPRVPGADNVGTDLEGGHSPRGEIGPRLLTHRHQTITGRAAPSIARPVRKESTCEEYSTRATAGRHAA